MHKVSLVVKAVKVDLVDKGELAEERLLEDRVVQVQRVQQAQQVQHRHKGQQDLLALLELKVLKDQVQLQQEHKVVLAVLEDRVVLGDKVHRVVKVEQVVLAAEKMPEAKVAQDLLALKAEQDL